MTYENVNWPSWNWPNWNWGYSYPPPWVTYPTTQTSSANTAVVETGWKCPGCGRYYNPVLMVCSHCPEEDKQEGS